MSLSILHTTTQDLLDPGVNIYTERNNYKHNHILVTSIALQLNLLFEDEKLKKRRKKKKKKKQGLYETVHPKVRRSEVLSLFASLRYLATRACAEMSHFSCFLLISLGFLVLSEGMY